MPRRPDDPGLYFETHVFMCVNERPEGHPRGCCKARGAEALRDYMKSKSKGLGLSKLRINQAGCLDRCELGPTMVIYPEGIWYTVRTEADIDEVLETHLKNGGRVERLMLPPELTPAKAAKLKTGS